MAEMLVKWPTEGMKPKGQPRKYNWDIWLDGNIWKLEKGKDYNCSTQTMTVNCYGAAKRNGLKVRMAMTLDGQALVFQSYKLKTTRKTAEK